MHSDKFPRKRQAESPSQEEIRARAAEWRITAKAATERRRLKNGGRGKASH